MAAKKDGQARTGAESTRPRRLAVFRKTMLAGITIIAPLWITGLVLWTLFKWADSFSAPIIRQFAAQLGYEDFQTKGPGFLLTIFIVWIIGVITTNVLGKRLLHNTLMALGRLPLVRTIYEPVQKLTETMTSPDKAGFKKVVLVEYPRQGMWTLGFLAGDVPREAGLDPAHSIFVPTAPNPTTGFMLIVPPDQLKDTDLSTEAAFQMIVSAGVAVPDSLQLLEGKVAPPVIKTA
ncbi:MAG: DUF502 domain-containing protein [Candidatus Latescibacteria bacterium]|nr:DUF502 domain-containing protein [Candidatus Latescibacterota bacterium]